MGNVNLSLRNFNIIIKMRLPPLNLPLPYLGGGERGGGNAPIGLIYCNNPVF